ncbi:MAG: hypothetical protein KKG91_05860 [Candidatus Omnitrophica bacterium]|nr:hypothetical protein [Candidatus Omnitrophota bacterium]
MKIIKIVFLLLFLLLPILLYSAESYRNPFESLLPKEEAKVSELASQEAAKPLDVVIQGVLWGSAIPQAIIDGDVYKVGDKLKSIENASLLRITDNVVFIVQGDKVHKMTVKKK